MRRAITCSVLGVLAAAMSGPARASSFQVVHVFRGGDDGAVPQTALLRFRGMLYGTTYEGGVGDSCAGAAGYGCGTVYTVHPSTGAEAIVYAFGVGSSLGGPTNGLTNVGGTLYGAAANAVYSLNPTNGDVNVLHEFSLQRGAIILGSLARFGDRLYGTTQTGNNIKSQNGVVFSVHRQSGHAAVVARFTGAGGSFPEDGVIEAGGIFYGTTYEGGAHGAGAVFALDPTSDVLSVVYSFGLNGDGANPDAGLLDVGGTFYGTTTRGGAFGYGTVFSVNP